MPAADEDGVLGPDHDQVVHPEEGDLRRVVAEDDVIARL